MRGLHIHIPNSTDNGPAPTHQSQLMRYEDMGALLRFTVLWKRGLGAAEKLFRSSLLCYPLLISKEVKSYIIRQLIYLALLGNMATYEQQPELCESSILSWTF